VSARRLAGLAGAAALAACALRAGTPPGSLRRFGPDRLTLPYLEPRAADKRALFERINRDRLRHGLAALHWEPRAARVGDAFCLDAALTGASGHWDRQGRAPYLRWGLAGGVDYHAQNAASFSLSGGRFEGPLIGLLLEAHETMMAEVPPGDGHRRLILDPEFTHLGIGLAVVGGQLRLSEEFTRVAFEWVALPAQALPAGSLAAMAGLPRPGWRVALVEIRFEPPPRPLSLLETRARGSYGYPPPVRTLHPGPRGDDIQVRRSGEVGLRFPLDQGPGHYFVLCYLERPGERGQAMLPATAAMVTAAP
jgi:uncharacterized protein YkwD